MSQDVRRWQAKDIGSDYWYVESDGKALNIRAHCKCCALTEAIEKHGGDCDLRGLSGYGACYQFLGVLVRRAREGEDICEHCGGIECGGDCVDEDPK